MLSPALGLGQAMCGPGATGGKELDAIRPAEAILLGPDPPLLPR